MIRLEVAQPDAAREALYHLLDRSAQSRFEHRLHCVLLVGAGHSCGEVANVFGDDARTVQRWVRKFLGAGVDALREASPPGRPSRLTTEELEELGVVLKRPPALPGHPTGAWNGELLRAEIVRRFAVGLSRRHCQRLLAQLSSITSDTAV